jgi:hypothetical protein
MAQIEDDMIGKLLRGGLAGLIAGATASFAMDRFQAAVTALSSSDNGGGEKKESATEKAAGVIAKATTGEPVPEPDKPLAGQGIHYALGIGLGVAYGIAAEFAPAVTKGSGVAFGLATATLLDETMVPAVGLGAPPWKAGLWGNAYSYLSHLVFGGTAEIVRSQVAGTLEN